MANRLKLIIECELCPGLDVHDREQPDPDVTVHCPLLCDAVGVAGVVHEPGQVPLGPRVDHPVRVDGEVVVVLLARELIGGHPSPVLLHRDQLPYVLDHKPAPPDHLVALQPPAPALYGAEALEVGILPLLEPHVATLLWDRAHPRVTLKHQHPVDTVLYWALIGRLV